MATPGAEPRAAGGYAAALLLDGWVLLGRASLRAAEEALRRWLNAAALVRAGADGGRVVVVAESALPAVQALIRWDPVTHAERELAERAELLFPPAVRMAALTGPRARSRRCWPPPTAGGRRAARPGRCAGPTASGCCCGCPGQPGSRWPAALHAAQAVRSARKEPGAVRVQLDPAELI